MRLGVNRGQARLALLLAGSLIACEDLLQQASAPDYMDLLTESAELRVALPAGTGAPDYLRFYDAAAWDFEDPEENRWEIVTHRGETRGGVTERFAQGGKRCFMIEAGERGADADAQTHVRVKPSTDYKLEAYLKTIDLEPVDARLYGTFYLGEFSYVRSDNRDMNDPILWHTSLPKFRGTTDGWKRLSYSFRTRPESRMLRLAVSLGNWGYSKGGLCFDEVRLAQSTPSPGAAANVMHALVGTELRRSLEDVGEAARSVRVLVEYLEQHPEALIRGKR